MMAWYWAVLMYGGAGFVGAFTGTLAGGWLNARVILRRLRIANENLARAPNAWTGMPDRWTGAPWTNAPDRSDPPGG